MSTSYIYNGVKLKPWIVTAQLCDHAELPQAGHLHLLCVWRLNTVILELLMRCMHLSVCAVMESVFA